jgi:hypothetical protein
MESWKGSIVYNTFKLKAKNASWKHCEKCEIIPRIDII